MFHFKEQSQKRYMVSDSLCPTSFINVEFKVSLVLSGQRPRREGFLLPQRKWATEATWRASGEVRRVLKRARWALEPAGRALDGAGGPQSQVVGL